MIDPAVPFDDISENHLAALIEEGVAEKRTIEYKRQLPATDEPGKREFLCDVSSFANASGGDLLFGIEAEDGVPTAIRALMITPDSDLLRWEQVMRSGIAPRLPSVQMRAIPVNGGHVILMRLPRSWFGPHAVSYKGFFRFYSRGTAGKVEMDVVELRQAFINGPNLSETIRNFQNDRIGQVLSRSHPTVLAEGAAKIVIHLIPLAAFTSESTIDLAQALEHPWFTPFGQEVGDMPRWNIDGLLTTGHPREQPARVFAQLFRNGIYEGIDAATLTPTDSYRQGHPPVVYALWFEQAVLSLNWATTILKRIGATPPVAVLGAIVDGRGVRVSGDPRREFFSEAEMLDRDVLVLPDVMLESLDIDRSKLMGVLRPMVDGFWQAAGRPGSTSWDESGAWNPNRR